MKASTLLRRAADNLWDGNQVGGSPTLCGAVRAIAREANARSSRHAQATTKRINDRIAARLCPHLTMASWLFSRRLVSSFLLKDLTEKERRAVQAHRKAWALMLADEFEKEGD